MNTISSQEQAALAVLKSTKVNILEAALEAKEALAVGRGRVKRARKCIAAGAEALQKQEKTVTFEKAVAAGLGGGIIKINESPRSRRTSGSNEADSLPRRRA